MNMLAAKLMEKHLEKIITDITIKVCRENFDSCFREACDSPNPKNTTIGTCSDKIYELAKKEVQTVFDDYIEEINNKLSMPSFLPIKNPFLNLAYDLFDEFLYYYYSDSKYYVMNTVDDECKEKEKELQLKGILDSEGDIV